MKPYDVEAVRAQFPALDRRVGASPAVYFDGPAGSQVPRRVIDAVSHTLTHKNANTHGAFVTSREADALLADARATLVDFFGAPASDADAVIFGNNMTSLTLALSRSLARTWKAGDEVLVTRLDHDANITPWVLAARDAGATIRKVEFRASDCTLDLDDFDAKLSDRTRLVAISAASNATGTLNPVRELTTRAHRRGAQVFVDAVHYAPHALIDVSEWGCDFAACSAYKFFGPHVGVLWGRRELLAPLPAYQVRPAADVLPDRFSTGTGNHEGIAGTREAVEYLAALGSATASGPRRQALRVAFDRIVTHERALLDRLLRGLESIAAVRVWGIRDRQRLAERAPTVAFTHERHTSSAVAAALAERGIFVWSGHFYAVEVTESLGLEPEGVVRVGLLHYNTADEVDRLLEVLHAL